MEYLVTTDLKYIFKTTGYHPFDKDSFTPSDTDYYRYRSDGHRLNSVAASALFKYNLTEEFLPYFRNQLCLLNSDTIKKKKVKCRYTKYATGFGNNQLDYFPFMKAINTQSSYALRVPVDDKVYYISMYYFNGFLNGYQAAISGNVVRKGCLSYSFAHNEIISASYSRTELGNRNNYECLI